MPADSPLWAIYRQWKGLTEAEGNAILSSDWAEVRRCQAAKRSLQPEIIRETEQASAALGAGTQEREFQAHLRAVVNELIRLETENNSNLSRRMAGVDGERRELESTGQRLRKVHQSYVPARGPVWNRYS